MREEIIFYDHLGTPFSDINECVNSERSYFLTKLDDCNFTMYDKDMEKLPRENIVWCPSNVAFMHIGDAYDLYFLNDLYKSLYDSYYNKFPQLGLYFRAPDSDWHHSTELGSYWNIINKAMLLNKEIEGVENAGV